MRLYLARHAQTPSNVVRALDTGYPGAALTEEGHQQAARLAERLAGEPFDVVAASPLLRAQQTAAPLAAARGLDILTLDGLREVDAGDLEMAASEAASERYAAMARTWADDGDLDAALPGGITGHEFLRRFDAAVTVIENAAIEKAATEKTQKTQKTEKAATTEQMPGALDGAGPGAVVASHGTAIRIWAAIRCRNSGPTGISRRKLANTDVLVVEGDSRSGWRLERRLETDTGGIVRSDISIF